jgi:hypothetical protein
LLADTIRTVAISDQTQQEIYKIFKVTILKVSTLTQKRTQL